MYKKEYKFILFLTYLMLQTSLFFAASTTTNSSVSVIDEMERSWFSVLSGSPSSVPFQTNYGFLIVEDSKFLSSYSRNGQKLWQTTAGSKIKDISISDAEFISIVNQKNQLLLLNPSGLTLWNQTLTFIPQGKPFFGFDGRIFVRGSSSLACFGINGLQKWNIQTEIQNSLEPETLNDGSIIVFLEKTHDGKTCALRISPFGNVLEEIVFQGKVVNAFSADAGIILVFSGGEIGMCSIKMDASKENGLIYSKWINKEVHCNDRSCGIKISSQKYAVFTPGERLLIINQSNGTIERSVSVLEITSANFQYFETVDDKFIITDSSTCVIYNTAGRKLKTIQMPSKTGKYNWEYSCFIKSGYLTFMSKDWTVNSFKIISTSKENEAPAFSYYKNKNLVSGYKNFIITPDYKPEKKEFSESVFQTLKSGNTGIKEIEISNTVNAVLNAYFTEKTTESFNHEEFEYVSISYNLADMERILNFIPVLQSHFFQQKIATLLSVENDRTMIIKLLKITSECAYDPSGEILSQIELLVKRTNPKDHLILQAACDAVYNICRFMGRPALLSKGKEILTGLFYPQYDEATKKASRQAMQKLADLNM